MNKFCQVFIWLNRLCLLNIYLLSIYTFLLICKNLLIKVLLGDDGGVSKYPGCGSESAVDK